MAKGSSRKSRSKSAQNVASLPTSTIPQSVLVTTVTDDMTAERPVSPPTTSKIDARPHLEAGAANGYSNQAFSISALAQTTIPMWVQTFIMISLIFGGCCSNVRNFLSVGMYRVELFSPSE